MSQAHAALPPSTTRPWLPWLVCGLLFLATTINYLDRTVLSLIEPVLHDLPFLGWNHAAPVSQQSVFNNNFGNILIAFQISYGLGFLFAGRLIDRLGTKTGYALAVLLWSVSAMAHALVASVAGFALARFALGLGESGNFPAAIKAITEWFPAERRALATGVFNSGTNAASLIAPWAVPLITVRFGWQAAFLSTGALGLLWLALWLAFPYNRLRPQQNEAADTLLAPTQMHPPASRKGTASAVTKRGPIDPAFAAAVRSSPGSPRNTGAPPVTQPRLAVGVKATDLTADSPEHLLAFTAAPRPTYLTLLRQPNTWAFSLAKFLTDPVWWFYLFWLPKYFHETYGLTLTRLGPPIIVIYFCSSFGSVGGGWLSGVRMRQIERGADPDRPPGISVRLPSANATRRGRRFALLTCAFGALPVMLVPFMARLTPGNVWPAVALLSLAAAAHQGWSANLYNTPGDTLPAAEVSTVVGIGSAAGALGGALFTWLTKTLWTTHPFVVFFLGSVAYLTAYLLFRALSRTVVAPDAELLAT